MKNQIESRIKEITQYEFATITKRANQSILLSLRHAKELGYTKIFIPQSGGWITYEQFASKLKLAIHTIPTVDEKPHFEKCELDSKSIIIIHSLAGYHTTLDTRAIRALADTHKSLFIEDMCGTFGNLQPNGHIILGSFGNAKPLAIGNGGFVATNIPSFATYFDEQAEYPLTLDEEKKLYHKLANPLDSFQFFFDRRNEILAIIPDQDKIIGDENALVLIVEYKTQTQKQTLIDIAKLKNVEYTECPRYIRHDKPAISFEIKRIVQ